MKRGLLNRCRTAGFTIVEVAMAGAIMALAITTSITTLQRGFQSLDTARNLTIAGQIMQSELETMRLQPWTTIDAFDISATPTVVTIDTTFTSNTFIGNRFALTRQVTLIRSGLKQVTLTTSWKNYDGRSLSRSYMCYYGQNGLYDYFYNSL